MTFYKNIETNELEAAPITELIQIKKRIFITKEQADYIKVCDECGEIININTDEYESDKNIIVCGSCYEHNYFHCEYCGELHHIDDGVWIEDKEIEVCENCADNYYYKCSDCGRWFSIDGIWIDRNITICETCSYTYIVCEGCGDIIYIDDSYYNENDGYSYCESCYNDLDDENIIHNHDFKPDAVFYHTEADKEANNKLFFGIELETAGNTSEAESFLNFFNDELYLKYDSSVGGFECVIHPMTYDYINNIFKDKLEKGLDYLKSCHFKAHNEGGIHIHFSRRAITTKQLYIMYKILYIMNDYDPTDILLTISQRKENELRNWANNRLKNGETLTNKELYTHLLNWDKTNIDNSRYTALNLANYNTIECRIFNSNLRIERVLKNIQFLKALIDYTAQFNNIEAGILLSLDFTINDLLHFIDKSSSNYPELFEFLVQKSILKAKTQQLQLLQAA